MPLMLDQLRAGKSLARAYRGPFASAYMKAVRLNRPEDAIYWLTVMHQGHAGDNYLRRRIFGSAGEDNVDTWPTRLCERLFNEPPTLETLLWAGAYALSLGTKWYELPDGQEYTRMRASAGLAGHPNLKRGLDAHAKYKAALEAGDVEAAYWWLDEGLVRETPPWPFYTLAADRGDQSPEPVTNSLAKIIRRQHGWLGPARKTHLLKQLIWAVCRKPLASAGRRPDEAAFKLLMKAAAKRLARGAVEPVPSWARDGVHVAGSDPRFAGSWEGCLNMVEMYQRYGRLDVADPGITLLEGGPPPVSERVRRERAR